MTENELRKAIAIYKKTLEVTADNGETCFTELDKNTLLFLEELEQYRAIGTVEEFKAVKLKEHNYDNCHNYTCRKKCEKDGYAKAIDEFAEKFIFKAVCEGCSGCCDCYENETQNTCEDWKYYMEIVEQMKGGAERYGK